ncbi:MULTISPECIES: hypothetical protein [Halomonadaceae]|uniref:hypothetical protein n=1 Tax=Halomonadaceae TaxID=28256 RepID=UPI00159B10A4|nr:MULTISPECIES: hypothetical protein [Halomonas]QJQ93956.1 hypothetical protein HIO72_00685 [Halomonas sp. PA5]
MNSHAEIATPSDMIKNTMKRAGCPLSIDQQMVLAGSVAVFGGKDDHVNEQLCQRIEELEHEKTTLNSMLDAAEKELASNAQESLAETRRLALAFVKAKGRYHAQQATCDLMEHFGMPCTRPTP